MLDRNNSARAIQESIRQILLKQWDPIGINDIPEAQDEYDNYVWGVYRLLISGASEEEIIQHLFSIEVDTIGLQPIPKADTLKTVASALLQLDCDQQ